MDLSPALFLLLVSNQDGLLCNLAVRHFELEHDHRSAKECVETARETADVAQPVHNTIHFSFYLAQILAELKCHGTLYVILPVIWPCQALSDIEYDMLILVRETDC